MPLFLAEQVEFGSEARVQTLVPWVTGEMGGFALSGGPWPDQDAANYARQGEIKSDYVVVTHLKPNAAPWTLELRLVRTIDGKCLGTLAASFPPAKPEEGVPALAQQLLSLVAEQAEVESAPTPPLYQVPGAAHFADYLFRLEQLLAVRCAGMDGVKSVFLTGGRQIIDGNVQLCLGFPENVVTRILLAQTLLAMKKARPEILPEFKEKIDRLQKENVLAEPAESVIRGMFNRVFTT